MRVAIPKVSNKISLHFGQSEGYAIYEIDQKNNKIMNKYLTVGCKKGCQSVNFLSHFNVDTLIVSGISDSAIKSLQNKNINVIKGVTGYIDKIIKKFINNTLLVEEIICSKCNCCGHNELSKCK